eukprot:TRINITY_DN41242_c0_g1_i1.p1 TRINITY_DN41242_c0_g1~~TRINITY_DN41242_c0_g1_i1.p1  ORF type:complete len:333 (+),score=53.57 TRINITY_DN41242_c0_g1_i1:97-1095(+)
MRVTFVFGRIVHFYWRIKPSADLLSASTKFGTQLDFSYPDDAAFAARLRGWVAWFADKMELRMGGVDLCWENDDFTLDPTVFEVSPVFDMNPPPPKEWIGRPYRDFRDAEPDRYAQLKRRTYASLYESALPLALCERRSSVVYVDIDNTVADAMPRIRRWTKPTWPGSTIDPEAYMAEELLGDPMLEGSAAALRAISQRHAIVFLSARARWAGAYEATLAWLEKSRLPFSALHLVPDAASKVDWLLGERSRGRQIALLIDDLTKDHHTASTQPDWHTQELLATFGLPFVAFDFSQPIQAWQAVLQHPTLQTSASHCHHSKHARDALPHDVPR